MTNRVSTLKWRAWPDMLPFNLFNKKRLAIRRTGRDISDIAGHSCSELLPQYPGFKYKSIFYFTMLVHLESEAS